MPSTPVRDTANSKSARMPTRVFRMRKNPACTRRRPKRMTSRHVSQETTREQHPAEKCPFENFPHRHLKLQSDNKRGKSPSTRPETVSTRILRTLRTEPCHHTEAEEEPLRNRDLCRNPHGRIQCGRKLRDIRCHCLSRRETAPNDRSKSFLRPYRTKVGDRYRILHRTPIVRAPRLSPGQTAPCSRRLSRKRSPSDSPMFGSRTAKKRIREGIIATVF